MTREEAMAILEVSKHMATSGRMYNQAIDMAIEALSAEHKHCWDCKHYEPKYNVCHVPEVVKQVTSKLKKPCDSLLTEESNGSKEHKSKLDLISRQDVIEALSRSSVYAWSIEQDQAAHDWALNIINALPSADAVHKPDYSYEADMVRRLKESLSADAKWIPCSERLPKEDEYVGNVCKYYLIQDEYGDMHVAHLSGRGWETIESVKALGCDVVAWMPLPTSYKGGGSE